MSRVAIPSSWVGAALLVPAPAFAQSGDRFYGPHMWEGGWWMFLGPIWMIVVIAAIVAVVVLIVRWSSPASHAGGHGPAVETPMDILRKRFARGEIDKDEFEERRKLLE